MGRRGPSGALNDTFRYLLWYWYIHENQTLSNTRVLFRQQHPNLEIYQQIPDFPSEKTLQRAFIRWEYSKNAKSYNSDHLNRELWVYFYYWGLNDREILTFLNSRGYSLNARRCVVSQTLTRFLHICRLNHNTLTDLQLSETTACIRYATALRHVTDTFA